LHGASEEHLRPAKTFLSRPAQGYQISQFDQPLATSGTLYFLPRARHSSTRASCGSPRGGCRQIDSRSLCESDGRRSHRSGVPLIEIVGGPDLRSPAGSAARTVLTLKQLLEYIGISDCDMERAAWRGRRQCLVRRAGETAFQTRVPRSRNINSFAFVEKALTVERDRQIALVESGGSVTQQTMLYDFRARTRCGRSARRKKVTTIALPGPDLPPLVPFDAEFSRENQARASAAELPAQKT